MLDETELDFDPTQRAGDGRNNQSIIIENGKTVVAVAICAAFAALGVGLSAFACYTATQSAMESRLLQQHVMSLEAELHAQKPHQ